MPKDNPQGRAVLSIAAAAFMVAGAANAQNRRLKRMQSAYALYKNEPFLLDAYFHKKCCGEPGGKHKNKLTIRMDNGII